MFVFNETHGIGPGTVAIDLRVAEAVSRLSGPRVHVDELGGDAAFLRVAVPGRGRSRRVTVSAGGDGEAATVRVDLDGRRDFPLSRRASWEDRVAAMGWSTGGREWSIERAVDGNFCHDTLVSDVGEALAEVAALERVADRIAAASTRFGDTALMSVLRYIRYGGRLLSDGTVVARTGLAPRVRERILIAAVSSGLMASETAADGVEVYGLTGAGLALASGDVVTAAYGMAS
jgi:hypothetical protein